MSYNARLRATQKRVWAVGINNQEAIANNPPKEGQKFQGWEVGSSQASSIGIPAKLVRKVAERTNTKVNDELLPGGTRVLADTRCLVVTRNTLSGVGRYRSQFNTDAASRSRSGIKSVRYWIGDKNESGVLDYIDSECKRCLEPINFCDAPPCAGPCSVQDPGTMLLWFANVRFVSPLNILQWDVFVRFGATPNFPIASGYVPYFILQQPVDGGLGLVGGYSIVAAPGFVWTAPPAAPQHYYFAMQWPAASIADGTIPILAGGCVKMATITQGGIPAVAPVPTLLSQPFTGLPGPPLTYACCNGTQLFS
jgi:hypothetical protein